MASPNEPTPNHTHTVYICQSCDKEFIAPDVIAKKKVGKKGIAIFKADKRKVKLDDIEDVVMFGHHSAGLVVICPRRNCQTFHS